LGLLFPGELTYLSEEVRQIMQNQKIPWKSERSPREDGGIKVKGFTQVVSKGG
jgi:hypothetical protein